MKQNLIMKVILNIYLLLTKKKKILKNKYNHKDLDYKKSKPINIINKKINSDEFEIIDVSILKQQSLPVKNKTVTESLKEYLYSSINLIKQSYNYVAVINLFNYFLFYFWWF